MDSNQEHDINLLIQLKIQLKLSDILEYYTFFCMAVRA